MNQHSGQKSRGAHAKSRGQTTQSHAGSYRQLLVSLVISYVVMYAAMYGHVDVFDDVYLSLSQAYMVGLMVAPMLLVMLGTMPSMYGNKKLNAALVVAGLALTVLFWILIRTQAAIGDRQFLRAMITHHSGAILMCEDSDLSDPGVKKLCQGIVESQQREIAQMKQMLGG